MPEIIDTPKRGRKSAADLIEAPIEPANPRAAGTFKPDSIVVKAVFGDANHLVANIDLKHNTPTEVPNDGFTQAQVEAGKWVTE